MLALGLLVRDKSSVVPQEERETTQSEPAEAELPAGINPPLPEKPPVPGVRVTMVDPTSAVIMPVESRCPNVTIVRIFPTIRVAVGAGNMNSP